MGETSTVSPDAGAVLYVDDEAASRRWFARALSDEFSIVTAGSVQEALAVLGERGASFAVLLTDFRMPGADGMKLLRAVQEDHRHLIRLLVTAYAGKEVAMAAVNQGKVLRILEKPLEDAAVRDALREAQAVYRSQALERAANEGRLAALRETLGFLAHELNTPLATARGCVASVAERYLTPQPGDDPGVGRFVEHHPGELIAALERAERRALYCQSLVSTFVQSARDAYPGTAAPTVAASSLMDSLLDEFPFEEGERSCVAVKVEQDFHLPGRRDLLYLVLCTLAKNALQALRGQPQPWLEITAGLGRSGERPQAWIRFSDNGPGIAPDVLSRLTREPVTTRAASGGNGMGVLFCQRVMLSLGGAIEIESEAGQGARVTLRFNRLV